MTSTGVHLVSGYGLPELTQWLVAALDSHDPDPFVFDWVTTPDQGMSRWLSYEIAQRSAAPGRLDGICAGVEWQTVARVLDYLTELASQTPHDDDPWRPSSLLWTVLNVVESAAQQEWSRQLFAHVGNVDDPAKPGRRMALAGRISRLFTSYRWHRPDMCAQWASGIGTDWQPHLWRQVIAATGVDPVARHRQVCDRLRAGEVDGLPPRLFVVDPAVLSPAAMELLTAYATQRYVGVLLPGLTQASHHDQYSLVHALGRRHQVRTQQWRAVADTSTTVTGSPAPETLLGLLQAHSNGAPVAKQVLMPADRSIQLHSSHGPNRQVEVLRDVLLNLFQDRPDIEPRDVAVVCPDIASYAPLLHASFGPFAERTHPGHHLRVRVAARADLATQPIVDVVLRALDLAGRRVTLTEVLEFIDMEPVSRRFGIDADARARLETLLREAGVRWGIDVENRKDFGLGAFPHNTWSIALDRLALSVAMGPDELAPIGLILPIKDSQVSDIDLIGAASELISRLREVQAMCRRVSSPRQWRGLLTRMIDDFAHVTGDDSALITQALMLICDAFPESDGPAIGIGDVRVLLSSISAQRFSRGGFGTGDLVVCDLGQLANVPHKVVCVLGLDEPAFPRVFTIDGDDYLGALPQATDPDQAGDDRQSLLSAMCAATDTFIVIYQGSHPRTNTPVPQTVALREIVDAIDHCTTAADGGPAHPHILFRHRLQSFAPNAFQPDAAVPSFDRYACAGARALMAERTPQVPVFSTAPLPVDGLPDVIMLKELSDFLLHPIAGFAQARGQLYLRKETDLPSDNIPVAPDNLSLWQITDRMLNLAIAGHDMDAVVMSEWLRGDVPPRQFGAAVLADLTEVVREQVSAVRTYRAGHPRSHLISLSPGDVDVRGLVVTHGDSIVDVTSSRPDHRHLLAGWVQLLALTAIEPGEWVWRVVGKGSTLTLGPVPPQWAEPVLNDLLDVYRLGLSRPLPLPARSARTYAANHLAGRDMTDPKTWQYFVNDMEKYLDERMRLFYPNASAILAVTPTDADSRFPNENTLFGQLACRIWEPMLRCMGGRRG